MCVCVREGEGGEREGERSYHINNTVNEWKGTSQNIKSGYLQWGFYFLIYSFYSFQIFYNENVFFL